jgi:soluble lytic murein transglycosylase
MLKRVFCGMLVLAGVLLLVGVRSARQTREPEPARVERAAPAARVEALAAAVAEFDPEIAALIRDGRPWYAALRMRTYLRRHPDAPPEALLLAARAEAEWGGWERVRTLLDGKPWLDRTGGGEGWFLLGRAREEERQWAPAADAYARYLAVVSPQAPERRVAGLLRGRALLQAGRTEAGIAALDSLRDSTPEVSAWAALWAANARAERGDTAGVRQEVAAIGQAATTAQAQRAHLRAYNQARDPGGARALALAYRQAAATDGDRAEWGMAAARAALAWGDTAQARADLRASLGASGAPSLFRSLSGLSTADRLALARAFHRQGSNASAAAEYRAWLASGAGSAEERRGVQLALGRALFAAGRNAEVERALRPLVGQSAEALYLTARAQLRLNQRGNARASMLRIAERFRGSPQAADALFLLADLAHDARELGTARRYYRRLLEEAPRSARAAQARMRLAGLEFLERDYRTAARIWEEGRSVSTGTTWAQATYWTGRAHQGMGDSATARARFREVRMRDPISYYAVRAADRLGEPFWPVPLDSAPPSNPAARERVERMMRSVDLLRTAGLYDPAEAEAAWLVGRFGDDPNLQYPLAEALNARGYTVPGTRLARRIAEREKAMNLRLLYILYPYAYRPVIEAEARANKLDPFMVAALTRQESTFKARISSPVGARGLMQVMPRTGRGLAQGAGIGGWDEELLFQPEINVHLGTRFLAAQMRQYNGSLPRVFSAYNAGPARVERWRRWPEAVDQELWTERIPFAETRDYVRILRRNIALYRGLYGS